MNMRSLLSSPLRVARVAALAIGMLLGTGLGAAPAGPYLDIPNVPFYIGMSVPPNVLITLDDSGSMASAYVPDGLVTYCSGGSCAVASGIAFKSQLNPLYYNPDITYRPPVDASGVPYTTSFSNARINGFDASRGTVNLGTNYRPIISGSPDDTTPNLTQHCGSAQRNAQGNCPGVLVTQNNPARAYYWVYTATGTKAQGAACASDYEADEVWKAPVSCFTFRQITAAEEQNFANWYSFYRTRNLAVVSSAMLALKDLPPSYRVGWQGLSWCVGGQDGFDTQCEGWDSGVGKVDATIRPFTQAKKNALWKYMSRLPASGGTPLRQALDRVGRYLMTTGVNSPYADTIGDSTTGYASCRQSYSVMMTDGIWNGSGPYTNPGNIDSTSTTLPDGVSYTPIAPYKDTSSDSVADIAFKYWRTDLQPTLTNNVRRYMPMAASSVPTTAEYFDPQNDPATWQHMTSFFVGLGLTNTLRNPDWMGKTYAGSSTTPYTGYYSVAKGGVAWPAAGTNLDGNVHDLWHAAINSRGFFFSVDTPDALLDAFKQINNRIAEGAGASTAAAASSFQVQSDSMTYTASFDATRWDGTIRGYRVNADGTPRSTPEWTTDTTLDYLGVNKFINNAKVFIRSPTNGMMRFEKNRLNQMVAADKAALDAGAASLGVTTQKLVDWLLGDDSEQGLRARNRLLGDVLGSQPVFEGGRDYGYVETAWAPINGVRIDGEVYSAYVRSKSQGGTRYKPTLYFGANDGMLHALDANTGARRWAYIPSMLVPKLHRLADPVYTHDYYVDGQIAIHDVHFGNGWKTILVATLGAGGKGMFAIDITDADSPVLLWEKTFGAGAGYITGEPVIARAGNGTWVVVVGNGYGSDTNNASLLVLDAQTGADLRTITPSATVPTSAQGMSSPALLYLSGRTLGYAYAGDWQGNLWRFNFNNPNPGSWTVDFSGQPLFRAVGPTGAVQRITAKPRIISDRTLGRVIVVGTGKMLETTDKDDLSVQTLYGIYDRASGGTALRSDLTAQTMSDVGSVRNISVNALSKPAGWMLDLKPGASGTGERIISAVSYLPELSLILASTVQPAGGACDANINSSVMALSPFTGAGRPLLTIGTSLAAGLKTAGMVVTPSVVRSGAAVSIMINRGSQGIELVGMNKGWNPRAAWRQLK